MQGGLGGYTAARLLGYGLDQIVQLEMVVPSGHHVRFGPTVWEDAQGFDVPKTLEVPGVCNTKPHEADTEDWVWEPCPIDIDFNELWTAVRGGGGGFGIVTAQYLQLNEFLGKPALLYFGTVSVFSQTCQTNFSDALLLPSVQGEITDLINGFIVDFFQNPSLFSYGNVTVTERESKLCSSAAGLTSLNPIVCYDGPGASSGSQTEKFFEAWAAYVDEHASLVVKDIPRAKDPTCYLVPNIYDSDDLLFHVGLGSNLGTILSPDINGDIDIEGTSFRITQDLPFPSYPAWYEAGVDLQIPKQYMIDYREEYLDFRRKLPRNDYLSYTGPETSDQMTGQSDTYRKAGLQIWVPYHLLDDDFWTNTFPKMYDMTDPAVLPGFAGHNHVSANTVGPLRSDPSKACPLDLNPTERKEQCFTVSETIFGTELLGKLQAIKKKIDPCAMFNVQAGVNTPYDNDACDPTPAPTPAPKPAPTPAPTPAPMPSPTSNGNRIRSVSSFWLHLTAVISCVGLSTTWIFGN